MTLHTQNVTPQDVENDRRILELLAQTFPNISAASTEIINLEAILNLPKGTEHFVADLHGEHEAFLHILKNASGNIKRKVTDIFGTTMLDSEIRQLCALIYYPEEKLQSIKAVQSDLEGFTTSRPQAGDRVSERVVEIYPLEGEKGSAARVFLYNRGAAP